MERGEDAREADERTVVGGKGKGREGVDVNVNGEVFRENMVNWSNGMMVKAGVYGVGWFMGMLGLWGDGA